MRLYKSKDAFLYSVIINYSFSESFRVIVGIEPLPSFVEPSIHIVNVFGTALELQDLLGLLIYACVENVPTVEIMLNGPKIVVNVGTGVIHRVSHTVFDLVPTVADEISEPIVGHKRRVPYVIV